MTKPVTMRPIPLLLAGLAIMLPLSLLAGRVWIGPFADDTRNSAIILMELRLPRGLLAITAVSYTHLTLPTT
ncbi:MAG: hypothetical protein KUG65_04155, partial [Sphingomonadaceae bacterium]|nr:hypothetical protein [Sphingomonadaceae bacterium]